MLLACGVVIAVSGLRGDENGAEIFDMDCRSGLGALLTWGLDLGLVKALGWRIGALRARRPPGRIL